jgi:hydrogenase nickel incorporation protein HypA/HybF
MHELAIADRLVDRAIAAAREADADRITALTVELGTATHLLPDQVRFCLEAVAEGTLAEGADVIFERVPARGECECGWAGDLDTLAETVAGVPDRRCPDCGTAVELVAGQECRLTGVTVPDQSTDRANRTDRTDGTDRPDYDPSPNPSEPVR